MDLEYDLEDDVAFLKFLDLDFNEDEEDDQYMPLLEYLEYQYSNTSLYGLAQLTQEDTSPNANKPSFNELFPTEDTIFASPKKKLRSSLAPTISTPPDVTNPDEDVLEDVLFSDEEYTEGEFFTPTTISQSVHIFF